ncbi:glutathione S-transferase family protein [Aureimonas jatrophae]|uniref:glutathione transferase n=1 Tax=Aureimonas jatrophae TaxID=1166073 RepID=A0A1H0BW99_9HYPH|nr:glutathione S-transferase [Aureimonas jatrophae]MBB3948960.1 glutathione S-transferase [Aureimonas jatrophae]SDN49904.1 glutathione S-transferase [Aureimonas jatrophae]
MLTIHHLENSRSQRVLWLLEELGLPYEVKRYKRQADLTAPPELRAVHPLGTSPVLEEAGLVLAETGAIVTYILHTHGRGRLQPPEGSPDGLRYQHFLHYAEGSAMPPLFLKLVLSRIPENAPIFVRPILSAAMAAVDQRLTKPRLERHFDYWDSTLRESGWFAGPEFTAADIMMSFPMEAAASRIGIGLRSHIPDFLARIHARPAYRRAIERGGPYAYA